MQVILIERVAKLGQIGDVVRVRSGFARNFLLPQGKALRATKENKEKFESMKAELVAKNAEKKSGADALAHKLNGQSFVLVRQAGETGQLYGSVSSRDIAQALSEKGFNVARQQIVLNMPIKSIGLHVLPLELHPEVEVKITVNVARSEEEAKRQAAGEDLTIARTEREEEQAQAKSDAEKFFEREPEGEAAEAKAAEGEPAEAKPAKAKPAKKAKKEKAED
ncbi:MAG TPA: 50S ribosomal protein L9 [Xanthobacteraceae bacterium]|nr:50S ribosomal protein L9 [Xanthobacteraceae bacterium]